MNWVILPSATETTTAWAGDIPEVPKAGEDFTFATGGRTTLGEADVTVDEIALDNEETDADDTGADDTGVDGMGALVTGPTVIGATFTDPGVEAPEEVPADDGGLGLVDAFPPDVQADAITISPRTAAIGDRGRADDMGRTRLTDQQPPGGPRSARPHRQPPTPTRIPSGTDSQG